MHPAQSNIKGANIWSSRMNHPNKTVWGAIISEYRMICNLNHHSTKFKNKMNYYLGTLLSKEVGKIPTKIDICNNNSHRISTKFTNLNLLNSSL